MSALLEALRTHSPLPAGFPARVENPLFSGLHRALDAQARRDEAGESAYLTLRDELIAALMTNPAGPVMTPGWKPALSSAASVVDDMLAGDDGALMHELLRIVGMAAAGKAGPEVHLRAAAWISTVAHRHAQFHCDDLVAAQEGGQ